MITQTGEKGCKDRQRKNIKTACNWFGVSMFMKTTLSKEKNVHEDK
jgi:hypothetical protein